MALCGALASAAPAGLQPCHLRGVEHPALCGSVQRPLDPAAPGGRSIDVHFAVLPAVSRNKKPDPVMFFAGGPGQSAIDLAGSVGRLLGRFSNRRDIVLIDQRGTGRSAALRCDGDDAADRPLRETADSQAQLQALVRCRQALQALPQGDLRQYTTSVAMQDAEAVRRVLGLGPVNLVGVSYGTRAALEYLRQHPQAVRRVVLDGVAPPDMVLPSSMGVDAQAAFDALLAWCDADSACRRDHPRLRDQWRQLLAQLPRDVTVPHPLTGREETVRMTADMLGSLLRAPLYSPVLASGLPLAIEQASNGRWTALVGLAAALSGGPGSGLAQGMHLSVICAEDMPLLDRTGPAGEFGASTADLYRRACADWPRGDVSAAFYRLPAAPVPVLLLSGEIDPVTPPRHAQRAAQALGSRARHVLLSQSGHGVMALACVRDLVFRFVDAADDAAALAADNRCPPTLPRPPAFVAPGSGVPR